MGAPALSQGQVLPATQSRSAALDRRVEALLAAGIEERVPHEVITQLGSEAASALIRAFEREDAPPYVRLRALSTLAVADDARAVRYVAELVRRGAERTDTPKGSNAQGAFVRSSLVLRRALSGLALRAEPVLDPQVVAPLLAHDDVHVRKSATFLLGRFSPERVRVLLEARMRVESSPLVRRSLQDALTGRFVRFSAPRPAAPRNGSPPR